MTKNNPYDLLDKEGIAKNLLGTEASKSLILFDKVKKLYDKHPTELEEKLSEAGKMTCDLVKKDIERIKKTWKEEEDTAEKKEVKKQQSKKIIEKSAKVMDDLDLCRQRLREDRKHKIESGEIAQPKKKTLVAKLRQELLKTATMIPKNLKEDLDVIQRTEKALLRFLNELKEIWGLNKIKPIEDEIKEKFDKLEAKAE